VLLETPVSEHADEKPLDLADGIYRPAPDALLATLRLSDRARWVAEYYPIESAREERDGGLTVTLRASDPDWLVQLVLRLGGTGTLVEPADLAERVRETALRALDQYA